jgi:predicted RNase H-like nuclease
VSVVLGIDAAWTAGQPSGVALVRSTRRRAWECIALAPSYESFLTLATTRAPIDWRVRPRGAPPDCDALLAAAIALAGEPPDVIAIDMPLATRRITRRRAADNAISSAYASRGLGVHTPNELRPGPIADAMRLGFGRHGYRVATARTPPGTPHVLVEAFPHAAAIVLAGAEYRVPYKLSRIAQYWPAHVPARRRRALLAQWTTLRRALAVTIRGGQLRIPSGGPLAQLKRYEDALDALICAWIGIEYLAGRLRAHGDATAAVWAH